MLSKPLHQNDGLYVTTSPPTHTCFLSMKTFLAYKVLQIGCKRKVAFVIGYLYMLLSLKIKDMMMYYSTGINLTCYGQGTILLVEFQH